MIVNIITYSVEIFCLLIFLEVIELNICRLNYNIKKNIAERATLEANFVYKLEEEDEDNDSEENNTNEMDDTSGTNSVYLYFYKDILIFYSKINFFDYLVM